MNYYKNINQNNITKNNFLEPVKPLLSNKSVSSEKIILAENQKIPLTNNKIAETFISSQILFTPQTSLNLVKVAQSVIRSKSYIKSYFKISQTSNYFNNQRKMQK